VKFPIAAAGERSRALLAAITRGALGIALAATLAVGGAFATEPAPVKSAETRQFESLYATARGLAKEAARAARKVATGEAAPPKILDTETLKVELLRSADGAIVALRFPDALIARGGPFSVLTFQAALQHEGARSVERFSARNDLLLVARFDAEGNQ
jgi:hypothetical protein